MSALSKYEIAKQRADEIDESILRALRAGKSFRVEAGAGSGKTYSLKKVIDWLQINKEPGYRAKGQKIACITYTNVAVDEITRRLPENSFITPSTIHAFAWSSFKTFQSTIKKAVVEMGILPEGSQIAEIHEITYDLGIRYVENGILYLFHDDVIKLFSYMLDLQKFRILLARSYPIILIDEYQDSFKILIDKFIQYFIVPGKGIQFGFFGDSWQTIYSNNGACGHIECDQLIEIKKESNFRSQSIIVDALNKIRPELPQISAIDENDGAILVITTNEYNGIRIPKGYYKDELPDSILPVYIDNVKKALSNNGWNTDLKVLMLTHKLLSKQQNYSSLLEILGDRLKEADDKYMVFFRDTVEPVYNAIRNRDMAKLYEAIGIKRVPVESKKQKKVWIDCADKLEIARKGTIFDVVKCVIENGMIPYPPEFGKMVACFETGEEYLHHKKPISLLYNTSYSEVIAALDFLSDDATYSTDHGVKGEEYENVFMVMGRGWNIYKFEDCLYKEDKMLSGRDLEAYIRNRNLFYVCCSRPKKRLAILITVPINTQFRNYLAKVFGTNSIMSYTDFMSNYSDAQEVESNEQ